MTETPLADRIDALTRAVSLARGRLPDTEIDAAARTAEKARDRLRHGTDHTVIALAGPTGAGKSSLYNTLCGTDLSHVGVRRPTTATTHACVWGSSDGGLLDWLDIRRRHHLAVEAAHPLGGLVVLDLPDFDSTTTENRVEVDRLVELVDLLVWVNDPQKYADESFHRGYVARLADHASVMRFVLNKTDTLSAEATDDVLADFARRLADDGIEGADVLPVSIVDGTGVDDLTRLIGQEVAAKAAIVARLEADLRAATDRLSSPGSTDGLSAAGRTTLVEQLGHAAGVDATAELVAAQHRRDARRAAGWPPLRWFRRRGREPIADLPRVGASAVATAEIASALRAAGDDAATGLSGPWATATRRAAQEQGERVAHALTTVTTTTVRADRRTPRWWAAVAALQRSLTTVALVGAVWLSALAVLGGFFRLDTDPLTIDTPGTDWIPLPSALLLGALLLSLLTTVVARVPAAVAARRHARRVRRALGGQVATVADEQVITPIDDVLRDRDELEGLLVLAAQRVG